MGFELRHGEPPLINGQELTGCVSILIEETPGGVHVSLSMTDPELDVELEINAVNFITTTFGPLWGERLRVWDSCWGVS